MLNVGEAQTDQEAVARIIKGDFQLLFTSPESFTAISDCLYTIVDITECVL